jgi:undecaprenyl-diphosphatase
VPSPPLDPPSQRAFLFESPALVLMLVAAAALWGFAELAGEVRTGSTEALDSRILLAFRNPADPMQPFGPPWLAEMMRDFTALGGVGVLTLLTAAAAGYAFLAGKSHAALAILGAVIGGIVISTLIKMGFDRPRPDLVPHGALVSTASFPSGHSMMSATVYLTLGALSMRLRPERWLKIYVLILAVLLTVLVGVSRVYLGVHWPTDVLAGWTVGAAWALLCWAVMLWLQRAGDVETDET